MFEILKKLEKPHYTPTRVMTRVLVRCLACGAESEILEQNARKANRLGSKHCAVCIQDTFHRMTNTRFWSIWAGMKARSTDSDSPDYYRYGPHTGRGICERWLDFRNFYEDMYATYADGLTIERIDNSRGYSKDNCRWATNTEQQANKNNNRLIEYQGERMHLAEFCRRAGVSRGAVSPRLNRGMTGDEAMADYAKSRYKRNRKRRSTTS